jgi:hypothetical protein
VIFALLINELNARGADVTVGERTVLLDGGGSEWTANGVVSCVISGDVILTRNLRFERLLSIAWNF